MPKDRQQLLVDSLRRLLRRGAEPHLRRVLDKSRAEDLSLALGELRLREARHILALLLATPERAAAVVSGYEASLDDLFEGLTVSELSPVFVHLASDDAADILPSLPEELREGILEALEDEEQEGIEELMQFAEDSAGGIMSTDLFSVDQELTARETIVQLQDSPKAELVFYVYCVNEEGTLVGVLSLRQLLLVAPSTQVKEIMQSDVLSVPLTKDQEEVARIVARYDLLAVPVVDEFNKLVGIITVDDVIDVLQDEAGEDMMLMAGVGDEEAATASTGQAVRTRLPWLLASVGGGVAAAVLIGSFKEELVKATVLAAFIPIVMGLGGNVGVQASTIVVRGIAMGQLDPSKFFSALFYEFRVVSVIALICAAIVAGVAFSMSGILVQGEATAALDPFRLAGAVSTSLLVVMVFGATLGTSVPLISHRVGIDPAVATGPILTTSIDVVGVLLYFLISVAWLGL
ncbi:MAG: magnesium transporter [Myxococcota bacterium]|nr:magnesium transporter [Myxococcota bacterium]